MSVMIMITIKRTIVGPIMSFERTVVVIVLIQVPELAKVHARLRSLQCIDIVMTNAVGWTAPL